MGMRTERYALMHAAAGMTAIAAALLCSGCPVDETPQQDVPDQSADAAPTFDNSELIATARLDPDWPVAGGINAYA